MMKYPFISLLSLLLASQASACQVPGDVQHWIVDYCLYKSETDDFLAPEVMSCIEKQNNEGLSDCAVKTKYKEEICTMMQSYFDDSPEKCLEDATFSGPTVRNGGI